MRRKAFIYRGLKGWVKNGSEIRSGFLFTQTLHDFYKNEGKWLVWGHIFTSGREYCSNGLISVFFMAVSAPSASWGALIGRRWFGGFAAVFLIYLKLYYLFYSK